MILILILITLWSVGGSYLFCELADGVNEEHIKIWKKVLFVFISGPISWFFILFVIVAEFILKFGSLFFKLEEKAKNFFHN